MKAGSDRVDIWPGDVLVQVNGIYVEDLHVNGEKMLIPDVLDVCFKCIRPLKLTFFRCPNGVTGEESWLL